MSKTLIIAEAGVNHNGSITTAFKLIDAACEAKVDYVKFQTFNASKLVSKVVEKADYQSKNTGDSKESQLAMLQKLQLSEDDHYRLIDHCEKKGIKFLSTAFDLESLDFLAKLGITLCKIPSGEITNLPYLKKAASLFENFILSTGMAELSEVSQAMETLVESGVSKAAITILHCNTEYPTPMLDVNLLAMHHLQKEFQVRVGYSDHTLGIEIPIAAVALGATVIEKHFTLDKNLKGPDHKASLEPDELMAMVRAIRNIEDAISGTGLKEPSESEKKNKVIARKSIHLARLVKKGEFLQESDLTVIRPGDGISPFELDKVIGKQVKRDLEELHKLIWEDLV